MNLKLPHKSYSLYFLLFITSIYSQYNLKGKPFKNEVSLHNYTVIADVGQNNYNIQYVINHFEFFSAKKLKNKMEHLDFTNSNFWTKTELKNTTNLDLNYFLESAGPNIYLAELYVINNNSDIIRKCINGFSIPYSKRSFDNRKTIFKINVPSQSRIILYQHLKSDGDAIKMQTILHSVESLLSINLKEQFLFGIFYGIIMIVAITYLFFYIAIGEKTIILYSLHLIFSGLMQFTIDGFFYQILQTNGNWMSKHALLFFGLTSIYLLGLYSESFLNLKTNNKKLYYLFNLIYSCIFILICSILFIPSLLLYSYQVANILGLITLLLIFTAIINLQYKKKPVDVFFTFGIFFLILGFTIFILNNFELIQDSFWVRLSPKIGTALEVIFLSVSMSNLIRKIKKEKNNLVELALKRAEELLDIKSHFLSKISHELRTPLNAILNLTDYISKETTNPLIKKNSKYIKYSSSNLLISINNILDYYKIENNNLAFDETAFSLEKILKPVIKNSKEEARIKKLDFKYDESENISPTYIGDANRLQQVINIVLNNALKYTTEGKIEFYVLEVPTENDKINLSISIKDTGIGMDNEKLEGIFNSIIIDEDNHKKKLSGLGLGLFIAKNIIERQNGSITINSELNKGTSCTISLIFKKGENNNPKNNTEIKHQYDLKGKSILVFEDNQINQLVIKLITKNWLNTSVSFAKDGKLGIEELQKNTYDLILMDLHMPIMDGYEATKIIRNGGAGHRYTNIPIIAVTADVMGPTKQKVKETGMNHYLSKPVNNATLFNAINDVLIKHEALKEIET